MAYSQFRNDAPVKNTRNGREASHWESLEKIWEPMMWRVAMQRVVELVDEENVF
jgi:hypothetical protein